MLALDGIPLIDVDDTPEEDIIKNCIETGYDLPLGHDEGVPDGLEVVPAVLVQRGRPHRLGGVAGSEPPHAGHRQLDPELVAVLPVPLQLDEVVEQTPVLAGDGLQVEVLPGECEPDGVEGLEALEDRSRRSQDGWHSSDEGEGRGVVVSGEVVRGA